MNKYQKRTTFVLRIAGAVIFAVGVTGLTYLAALLVSGAEVSAIPSANRVASVIWVIWGALLMVCGGPIGRFLGRGLE